MSRTIKFYREKDEFGCFSNFAAFPIELAGKIWPTSEHYFQAQKFLNEVDQEQIRQATSPGKAADMGRDRARPLRADWESVKDDIMRDAVRAKFSQHQTICMTLVATEDAWLVEHTANDSYWGDGGDGSGKNMLGRILMEIRKELSDRSQ